MIVHSGCSTRKRRELSEFSSTELMTFSCRFTQERMSRSWGCWAHEGINPDFLLGLIDRRNEPGLSNGSQAGGFEGARVCVAEFSPSSFAL